MIKNKKLLLTVVTSLLTAFLIMPQSSILIAAPKEHVVVEMTLDAEDFKSKIALENDKGKIFLADRNIVSKNVLEELRVALDISTTTNNTTIGIFQDNNDLVPIFITSNSKLSQDEYEAAAQLAKERYLEKNTEAIISPTQPSVSPYQNPNASYTLADTALEIYITHNTTGDTYWYTEYRIYKDSATTSLDAYYLRADHENLGTRYGGGLQRSLYRMTSKWDPVQSNVNTLDPEPATSSNQSSLQFSLPWGIAWQTNLGGSVDIETNHSIQTDIAEWEMDDWQLTDFYVMENFNFSHGIEVESPTSNNGFSMSIVNRLWDSEPLWGISHEDQWTSTISFNDNLSDLTHK